MRKLHRYFVLAQKNDKGLEFHILRTPSSVIDDQKLGEITCLFAFYAYNHDWCFIFEHFWQKGF